MRAAGVYYKGVFAGRITEEDDGGFVFVYDDAYLADTTRPPVSLTVPKQPLPYRSPTLFAFLWQLLPEGTNRRLLCELHRIDPADEFSILLLVAGVDTVGAVTVRNDSDD